jgi:hypothetical protein
MNLSSSFLRRSAPWLAVLSSVLFADSASATAPDSSSVPGSLRWYPSEAIFPRRVADGQTPQLSLNKDMDSKRIIGSIGGLQRFFETSLCGLPLQVSIGATVYGNFIRKPDVLDVVTVDFFVDFPVDIKLSDRVRLRTGWGHYSAHLADDGIETLNLHSINYAKDYIPFVGAYMIPAIGGFVYGGCRFDYYTIPEKGQHWVLQAGTEFGNIRFSRSWSVYAAVDVKSRQEISWASTRSFQLGLKTLEDGSRALRFAYTYRSGAEERGQFYSQESTVSLVGVYLDF